MINGRTLGLIGATAVSCLAGVGILTLIALDLLGEELMTKAWSGLTTPSRKPAATSSILESAKGITFFAEVPSKEHGLVIITGVAFETAKDFEAARQHGRWCYVMVNPRGALSRRIDLAKQIGTAPPTYEDLSAIPIEELASARITRQTLGTLARSHCRFAKAAASSVPLTDGGRT